MDTYFRLARMSPMILALTLVLLAFPAALLAIAISGDTFFVVPAFILAIIYGWVWLRFRPSGFMITPQGLGVVWPLKRRILSYRDITRVRLIDSHLLRKKTGWSLRIGAGGLWGGFGWLWTRHMGLVRVYVSRFDGFVWIDCEGKRPWLITPEAPEAFVRALTAGMAERRAHQ